MSQASHNHHIGVDMSKYHLDAKNLDMFNASESREKRFAYNQQGLNQLLDWLKHCASQPVRVYFEASGAMNIH